jgi:hypothetical protein
VPPFASPNRQLVRKVYCLKRPSQGIIASMLATLLGSLATIGTVTVLTWDWWRHPTL